MFHFRRHKDSKDSEAQHEHEHDQQHQQHHTDSHSAMAGSQDSNNQPAYDTGRTAATQAAHTHDPRGYHVTSDPLFQSSGQGEQAHHSASSDPNTRGDYIPPSATRDHADQAHGSHMSSTGGFGSHDPSASHGQQGQSTTDSMRQAASHASDKTSSAASSAAASMSQTAKQATGAIQDMMPDQLQNGLRRSAEQTAAYLQSLKDVIADHDRQNGSSSVNSSSMRNDIGQAETSVDKMKRLSEEFSAKGNDVSDAMMAEARKSVQDMMNTLNDLADRAKEYESHYPSTSSTSSSTSPSTSTGPSTTQTAKEKIVGATYSVQDSVISIMHAAREKAQNGFEALKQQLSSNQPSTSSTTTGAGASTKDKVVDAATSAKDTTVDNSSQAADATKAKTGEMAQGAQEQGAGLKQKAAQVLNQSLDYVADTLQGLKVEASTTDTAKNQAQSTASNVKDKASSLATDVKDKAQAATSNLKSESAHDESVPHHAPLTHAP